MPRTFLLFLLLPNILFAQKKEKLTLDQAIQMALSSNIQLKQNQLQIATAENNLSASKYAIYPTLSVGFSQGLNFGRSIDPYTNGYISQQNSSANLNFSASVPLFNGFSLKNTIAQNELNFRANQFDATAQKNAVTLNVIQAYLRVLLAEENIETAAKQLEPTKNQLAMMQERVSAGASSKYEWTNIQAQMLADESNLINAKNELELAKLNFRQVLNVQTLPNFTLEKVEQNLSSKIAALKIGSETILSEVQRKAPEIQGAEVRIQSAVKAIEVAKANKLPSISLNYGLGSNYSNVAGLKEGYFGQLFNNRFSGLNLSVRIPIFDAYQTRFRIANAEIAQQNAELLAQNTKLQIRNTIEQAYLSMQVAAQKQESAQKRVAALEDVFVATETRFQAGVINSNDYILSKTNLDRTKSDLTQAKFEYYFRVIILDFYLNKM